MSNDLLPINATPQERAISEAIARVSDVPAPARAMWDPKTCPADLLPWLAWSLSVDEWNAGWSDKQKRDTIAASFSVHSTKGTRASINIALRAIGYETKITEWWQEPAAMAPYTFGISVDTGTSETPRDLFTDIKTIVEQTKNTRSHLARIRVRTTKLTGAFVKPVAAFGGKYTVFDQTNVDLFLAIESLHHLVNYGLFERFKP